MAITVMCDHETEYEGAYCPLEWAREKICVHTFAEGKVLSLRERNGYDDSDFFATYWSDEQNRPVETEYASTRGWSYPNGAAIDATPETLAKYHAWQAVARKAEEARLAAREAGNPTKGKRVRVVKGRKLAKGTEAVVFWHGKAKEFGQYPRNGYMAASRARRQYVQSLGWGDPRDGYRVGLLLADGSKVFVDAMNVEVIQERDAA